MEHLATPLPRYRYDGNTPLLYWTPCCKMGEVGYVCIYRRCPQFASLGTYSSKLGKVLTQRQLDQGSPYIAQSSGSGRGGLGGDPPSARRSGHADKPIHTLAANAGGTFGQGSRRSGPRRRRCDATSEPFPQPRTSKKVK